MMRRLMVAAALTAIVAFGGCGVAQSTFLDDGTFKAQRDLPGMFQPDVPLDTSQVRFCR